MKTKLQLLILLLIPSLSIAAGTPTPTPSPTPYPVGPSFSVSWDANPATDKVTSYTVGYGTVSGTYSKTADVPSGASYDFKDLAAGPWYVAVLATNAAGQKGPYSKEISVTVSLPPGAPGNLKVSSGGLVNISTRAQVSTGDKVMIAGFILTAPEKVAVRALGPSLADAGVTGALSTAQVELHDASGAIVASNNGWKTGPDAAALSALHLAPSSAKESALIASLTPGNYTAIVAGQPDPGIGLVEVYQLP